MHPRDPGSRQHSDRSKTLAQRSSAPTLPTGGVQPPTSPSQNRRTYERTVTISVSRCREDRVPRPLRCSWDLFLCAAISCLGNLGCQYAPEGRNRNGLREEFIFFEKACAATYGAVECRTYGAQIILHQYPTLPGWAMFSRRPSGPRRTIGPTQEDGGNTGAGVLNPRHLLPKEDPTNQLFPAKSSMTTKLIFWSHFSVQGDR